LATLAELVEPPLGPVLPWVLTFKIPVLSRAHVGVGAQTLANEPVNGPPPVPGRVTVGVGPDVTFRSPSGVTLMDSPNAPPETLVTSA